MGAPFAAGARYIFELESGLLTSLEEILPAAKPDTPEFTPRSGKGARQWKTAEGAEAYLKQRSCSLFACWVPAQEVLTLEQDAHQIVNTTARKAFREKKARTLTTTAAWPQSLKHVSLYWTWALQ